MKAWAVSHQGLKRPHNQDRYLIKPLSPESILIAIADGMGGEAAGEVAAQMAVDALDDLEIARPFDESALVECIRPVCRNIRARALSNPEMEGMGTTLTVALIDAGLVYWAHVGDSRLYLLRRGRLERITHDHTAAAFMVEQGLLDSQEAAGHPARHMLFDCVGSGDCEPDFGRFTIQTGELIVLATDGMYGPVSDEDIAAILDSSNQLEIKLESLVQRAVDLGGRDDITVVGLEL